MPLLAGTTIGAFLLSICSAFLADHFLAERISIFGKTVGLERATNDGIAFGIDLPWWLLMILIPVALLLVLSLAMQTRKDSYPSIGVGLIIGGALANITDRILDGVVTDFIQIGWWPVFNVADSCITIGVAVLILWEFLSHREKRQKGP